MRWIWLLRNLCWGIRDLIDEFIVSEHLSVRCDLWSYRASESRAGSGAERWPDAVGRSGHSVWRRAAVWGVCRSLVSVSVCVRHSVHVSVCVCVLGCERSNGEAGLGKGHPDSSGNPARRFRKRSGCFCPSLHTVSQSERLSAHMGQAPPTTPSDWHVKRPTGFSFFTWCLDTSKYESLY